MATARVTASTVPQSLFTTPPVNRAVITSLTIDNQSAALRTIRLTDTFTPSPSVGTPSPSAQTIDRKQISVGAGLTAIVPESELRDVVIIGEGKIIADVTDAACVIAIAYHFE